jgi:hypothetical protein
VLVGGVDLGQVTAAAPVRRAAGQPHRLELGGVGAAGGAVAGVRPEPVADPAARALDPVRRPGQGRGEEPAGGGHRARLCNRRRSRTVSPPRMPCSSRVASASARQGALTGQSAQIRFAGAAAPPFSGKNHSGSTSGLAQAARSCQRGGAGGAARAMRRLDGMKEAPSPDCDRRPGGHDSRSAPLCGCWLGPSLPGMRRAPRRWQRGARQPSRPISVPAPSRTCVRRGCLGPRSHLSPA